MGGYRLAVLRAIGILTLFGSYGPPQEICFGSTHELGIYGMREGGASDSSESFEMPNLPSGKKHLTAWRIGGRNDGKGNTAACLID